MQVRLVDTSMHQADVRVELWTNLAHCLMPQPECAPDVMEETALSSLLSSQDQCVCILTHTRARTRTHMLAVAFGACVLAAFVHWCGFPLRAVCMPTGRPFGSPHCVHV
jgi:hypothetical protein